MFWASCVLLLASVTVVLRAHGLPPRIWVVRSTIYIASVSLLMLSTGGVDSGLGLLLLVPVVGVALYGEPWESACTVVAAVLAILALSLVSGPHLAGATPRRLFLSGSLGRHADHRDPHAAQPAHRVERTRHAPLGSGEGHERGSSRADAVVGSAGDHGARRRAGRADRPARRLRAPAAPPTCGSKTRSWSSTPSSTSPGTASKGVGPSTNTPVLRRPSPRCAR